MKRVVVVILVLTAAAVGQQATQAWQSTAVRSEVAARAIGPTYSDMYCAGFVADQPVAKQAEMVGGWDTPMQTSYAATDYVYLTGGGFQEGAQYSLVRRIEDPNRYEMFPGEHALLRRTGHLYADIGRVRVVQVQGTTAVAYVEFSCQEMKPGDVAMPFAERPSLKYRRNATFNRFAPANGKLTGQIVMAKNFDNQIATGHKVYLNVGANQGVKPGDYFRLVRTYGDGKKVEVDRYSYYNATDPESGLNPGSIENAHLRQYPRMSLGEVMILNVGPRTASAIVTLALTNIYVGDRVELEEPTAEAEVDAAPTQPKAAVEPSQPAAEPALQAVTEQAPATPAPPTISCSAAPDSVRAGELATITCTGTSAENRPLTYSFSADQGSIAPNDNIAVLDTLGAAPGPVLVLASVTDDRSLTSSAKTTITIASAAPGGASKITELDFKPNSALVDNVSKAMLDDLALRLQQDPTSTAVIVGAATGEEARELADKRAANVREYLKSKGVDEQRVQLKNAEQNMNKAEIWWIPAGAQMPEPSLATK